MLDDQHVVRAAPGQVGGVGALGVQRVGRDDRIGDVQAVQQGGEQGDLIGLSADLGLAQHYPVGMIEGGEQMAAVFTIVPRPA